MILPFILAAALTFSKEDASAALDLTEQFVRECTPRDAGTIRGNMAANWIRGKASVLGGNVFRDRFQADSPKGKRYFTNLYCPFERNPDEPWTVFVSHYDTKPGTDCPGANDGGATTCLLIQLCKVLFDNRDFKGNVMIIWTDAEECVGPAYSEGDGFQGSKRAAEMLKEKHYEVEAVYVLDMLGDKDLKIMIPTNVSLDLAKRVVYAAKHIGLTRKQLGKLNQRVLDDHLAFKDAGFDCVDLIDFEYGSKPGLNDYWHTPEDTTDKLSADSLLTVGRLICQLLHSEKTE